TQIFFEPNVQTGKQIAAAHFLDLELRAAAAATTPSDGQSFPSISPHNAFNGISTVRLKCGASRGRHASMVVFRYALNAFVMSLCSSRKKSCKNLFAIRFRKSLSRG